MSADVLIFLLQDGVATGAIYALLALGMILVFLVTRILFVPFGDIVSFSALTMAMLQTGKLPGTVWLVLTLVVIAAAMNLVGAWRTGDWHAWRGRSLVYTVLPLVACLVTYAASGRDLPMPVEMVLTLVIVAPIAPLLYRIAFEPLPDASVLVLLMIAIAVHFAIAGLALQYFGSEGYRIEAITDATFSVGTALFTGQFLAIVIGSLLFCLALYFLFARTWTGKALRAAAINRTGARLMGIRPSTVGSLTFLLASVLGVVSGILIGPTTTLYYDSGFLIGLKAFVGAIIGGLVSYPGAVAGAIFVGILENVASVLASSLKEVIIFGILIPILLLKSFTTEYSEDEEREEEARGDV